MTTDLIALPAGSATHPLLAALSWAAAAPSDPVASAGFDAADEFLLHEFTRRGLPPGTDVLVVNDRVGALCGALAGDYPVTTFGDSSIAFEQAAANLASNRRQARFVPSVDSLAGVAPAGFGAVLVRVPKSLALLEDQLFRIRPLLAGSAVVLCGGMDKHLSRGVNALLDRYIGASSASLGWRKARLIMATATAGTVDREHPSPFPTSYALTGKDVPDVRLVNEANVFSRHGLDQGTRILLPFLAADLGGSADPSQPLRVADLGCGNGVIGILSAIANPDARYSFFDESFMAVSSARTNWRARFDDRPATFVVGDAMADTPPSSFDVILCNPPFHQDHTVGDGTAWRMFLSAHRALAPDGSLLVVGNRHLSYHAKLHRLFGGVEQLGGTDRFVVLHARRT